MNKVYRFLLCGLMPILMASCATFQFSTVNLKDQDHEMENIVKKNLTYDPYADKLYVKSADEITKCYQKKLESALDTKEKRNHVFGIAEIEKYGRYTGTVTYLSWVKYYIKGDAETQQYYANKLEYVIQTKLSHDDVELFLTNGWLVTKIGPTQTSTTFKGYKVPLRFCYIVYDNTYGARLFIGENIDFFLSQEDKKENGPAPKATSEIDSGTVKEKLQKLKDMYDSKLITEDEYNQKRHEYLKQME